LVIERPIFDSLAVYSLLAEAFATDSGDEKNRKIGAFIFSAWGAYLDYDRYRERLKKAGELKKRLPQVPKSWPICCDRLSI